jgi:hypothetical protein
MRIHDDFELAGGTKRAANPAKVNDTSGEIGAAIAHPHQASVQTMLEVQRLAGNAGVNRLLQRAEDESAQARSPVLDVVGKGGGQPLGGSLQADMEGRLGADFSDVRVHTDSKASESARAVQANAYTVGSDVVVRSDRWSPESQDGKKTIAHELTHVMQQRAGPVDGTSQGDGVSVSNPADPFERAAERNAESAMAIPAPSAAPATTGASAQLDAEEVQRLVAQREGEPEEEEAQMQREGEPEEEEAQMQRNGEEEEEAQMQRVVQRHADTPHDAAQP